MPIHRKKRVQRGSLNQRIILQIFFLFIYKLDRQLVPLGYPYSRRRTGAQLLSRDVDSQSFLFLLSPFFFFPPCISLSLLSSLFSNVPTWKG